MRGRAITRSVLLVRSTAVTAAFGLSLATPLAAGDFYVTMPLAGVTPDFDELGHPAPVVGSALLPLEHVGRLPTCQPHHGRVARNRHRIAEMIPRRAVTRQ